MHTVVFTFCLKYSFKVQEKSMFSVCFFKSSSFRQEEQNSPNKVLWAYTVYVEKTQYCKCGQWCFKYCIELLENLLKLVKIKVFSVNLEKTLTAWTFCSKILNFCKMWLSVSAYTVGSFHRIFVALTTKPCMKIWNSSFCNSII